MTMKRFTSSQASLYAGLDYEFWDADGNSLGIFTAGSVTGNPDMIRFSAFDEVCTRMTPPPPMTVRKFCEMKEKGLISRAMETKWVVL